MVCRANQWTTLLRGAGYGISPWPSPSVEYTPRVRIAGSVPQQIVREHFETFVAEAAHLHDGEGLPRFVEEEFEVFFRCGWLPPHHVQSVQWGPRLAAGFARFRCGDCGVDRLVEAIVGHDSRRTTGC
jgi:hypothetical protein